MTGDAIHILRELVHSHGVIPSITVFGDLMLDRETERRGPLTEAAEKEAIEVAGLIDQLGPEILVLRKVGGLINSPTVLVSLSVFPGADLRFVQKHLAPLDELGSRGDRRDALEIPLAAELMRQLPREFRVTLRPNQFAGISSDIQIVGPGKRMFDVEARNRRSGIHDDVKAEDQKVLTHHHGLGITTIFLVPRCTLRFRRLVGDFGGIVIETNTYLVETEDRRDILGDFSWMPRNVELSSQAAPRIAARVVSVVLDGYDFAEPRTTTDAEPVVESFLSMREDEIESEIRRYRSLAVSNKRLDDIEALYSSGVTKVADIAKSIGYSRQTIWIDYRLTGRESPWSRSRESHRADPEST